MGRAREISYEVQVQVEGRWTIDSVHGHKNAALAAAQALVGANRHEAVRVLEESSGRREKAVFEQECKGRAEPTFGISPVEESPWCAKADDLYRFESRKTAGRLLRRYLDHKFLTAFEILHGEWHLRELGRLEDLVNQAIHRIAAIQARARQVRPIDRVDVLYKAVERVTARAKRAKDPAPYVKLLKSEGVSAARTAIRGKVDAKDRGYVLATALAAYLGAAAAWETKLGLVIELLDRDSSEAAIKRLDELFAEILDGGEAVKEIMGSRSDLADALRAIAQLSAGRMRIATKRMENTCVAKLNTVMAEHDLPLARSVLVERVAQGIRGIQPLTRAGEEADRAAMVGLVEAVTAPGGLLGGRAMSEGVVRRVRMVMGHGGSDLSAEEGIDAVLSHLPSRAAKLGFLLDLSSSGFGAKYQVEVLKALYATVKSLKSVTELVPAKSGKEALLAAVTDLNERIGTGLLPAEVGELIAKRLARLAAAEGGEAPAPKLSAAAPETAPPPSPGQDDLSRKVFTAGEYVFRQGDPGDEAYLVAAGRIEIVVESQSRETVIATVERGDIIGEMALIDEEPRMASARVVEDATLTAIPQESFRARLDRIAEVDRMIPRLLERYVERLRAQVHHG